jgi:hypothetical protein
MGPTAPSPTPQPLDRHVRRSRGSYERPAQLAMGDNPAQYR